jgi:ABC-type Zn uptake system ZnuABC Zn-binding protein ZnuA
MNNILSRIIVSVVMAVSAPAADKPLVICCTVPDLGALVEEVGGDQVKVTTFAKGPENPHYIEARPSFVRALADADVFIQTGLELEVGWAPVLLKNARNERVLPGASGFLEASSAIQPLEVPTGIVDRSLGDVHSGGTPHFFNDPVMGLKVASLIEGKLAKLRPSGTAYFAARYADFAKRLGAKLFGDELAAKYDPSKLALLIEGGKLTDFLKAQSDEGKLGGWLGLMRPYAGKRVVADHAVWPYLARTFAFEVVGYLEPKPGIPPTTKHLQEIVALMKHDEITVILSTPFFDPKHARVVSEQTGSRIAKMAHQVGALVGTDDYLSFIDHNVQALVGACAGK